MASQTSGRQQSAASHISWLGAAWNVCAQAQVAISLLSEKIVDANPAAARLWDYPLPDLVGHPYADLFTEDTAASLSHLSLTANQPPLFIPCVGILQRTGFSRIVDMTVAAVPSGEDRIILCQLTDIAASNSQAELLRLNWALSAYMRSSSALIRYDNLEDLVTRVCGAIVEFGVYVLSCVGLADPSPGKPVTWVAGAGSALDYLDGLDLSWDADLPEGRGPTGLAIRNGTSHIIRDTQNDPVFGPWQEKAKRFGLRSSLTVPFKNGDRVIGVLLIYACQPDVFGPKELSLFSQLADELAFAVSLGEDRARLHQSEEARRAAETAARDAEAELSQVSRLSMLGELTASISHEINQPLAAIVTNADASLHWLSHEPPNLDETRLAVKRIIRDASRANDIIAGIRAALVKNDPQYGVVDLNLAIQEVLIFTRHELRRAGVTVQTRFLPTLPAIRGDRIQLQQVLVNLILNGIDAMSAVTDRPRILQIRTGLAESGQALAEVEDCGAGLDPAMVNRLFERFLTTKPGGTGLGLAISRSIVDAHHGHIQASPASPHGMVFQVTLPLAEDFPP